MNYLKKRLRAFGFAFVGLRSAFLREVHVKLHFFIATAVIISGFYFGLSQMEWIVVSACITLVISLELINSGIEQLCNLLEPETNAKIKYIKDVCAAGVLIACIFSVLAGFLVFWPYIRYGF